MTRKVLVSTLCAWLLLIAGVGSLQASPGIEITFICPLCGPDVHYRTTLSETIIGNRLGSNPGNNGIFRSLTQCPHDRFVIYKPSFSQEELTRLRQIVSSAEYRAVNGPSYRRLALIYESLGNGAYDIALAYLYASWEMEGYFRESRDYLIPCLRYLKIFLANQRQIHNTQWTDALLLVGESERRLGKFEEAQAHFNALTRLPEFQEQQFREMIALQLELVGQGDSRPYERDEPGMRSADYHGARYLLRTLEDCSLHQAAIAARQLSFVKDPAALALVVPELLEWMSLSSSRKKARIASWILGRLAEGGQAAMIDAVLNVKSSHLWEHDLAPFLRGPQAVSSIISLLPDAEFFRAMDKTLDRLDPHWRTTEAAYSAKSQLLAMLQDVNSYRRAQAALTLSSFRDRGMVPSLVPLLHDADQMVRSRVAEALAEIGGIQALDALKDAFSDKAVRWFAIKGLAGVDDPGVLELFRATLHDENPNFRFLVAEILAERGDSEGVNTLLSLLENNDLSIQDGAARVLGRRKEPRAFDALLAIAGSAKRQFWPNVVWALGEFRDSRAIPVLARLLSHNDEEISRAAAEALQTLVPESARSEAIEDVRRELSFHLESEDSTARSAAFRTIGLLRDPIFIPRLLQIAKRSDYSSPEYEQAVSTICEIGRPAVTAMLVALENSDPRARAVAAQVLGSIGDSRALEPLLDSLNDPAEEVAYRAAGYLWRLHDPRTIQPLLELYFRGSDRRTSGAWGSLCNLGGDVYKSLLPLLMDKNTMLKTRDLLENIDPLWQFTDAASQARKDFTAALHDKNPVLRAGALYALFTALDPDTVQMAGIALGDESPVVRLEATEILGCSNDVHAAPLLYTALDDSSDEVRGEAAEMLGRKNDPDAIPHLLRLLGSASSTGKLSPGKACQALMRLTAETFLGCTTAQWQEWWGDFSQAIPLE